MTKQNRGRGRSAKGNSKVTAIAIVLVAMVAAGSFAAVRAWGAGNDTAAATVVVKDADGNALKLSLAEDATRTVTSSAGTNVIEVKDGRVRVREADCPNQDCVHQGWIDAPGKQIVCLPHKFTVDIVSADGSAGDIDVMGR